MKKLEKILVLPKEGLIKPYLKHGGFEFSLNNLKEILKDAVYGTRYLMEENENFKQIIPYIAFISNNKVLVYKRSIKGGENRLHNKYSLGVGGHVDLESKEKSALEAVLNTAKREVEEEIGIKITNDLLNIELAINYDTDNVGRVHFGLGFIIHQDISLDLGEKDILIERKFMNKKEIENIYKNLESWSQIFYNKKIKKLIL